MKATDIIGEDGEGGFAINLDGVSDEEEVANEYFNAAWVQQRKTEKMGQQSVKVGFSPCGSAFL